jgi:putative ABC transport system substrate-binding protein
LLAPITSLAQQQGQGIPRIAILLYFSLSARRQDWNAFLEGLRDLGYVEGRNISMKFASAEGQHERLTELAAELPHFLNDKVVSKRMSQTEKKGTPPKEEGRSQPDK